MHNFMNIFEFSHLIFLIHTAKNRDILTNGNTFLLMEPSVI